MLYLIKVPPHQARPSLHFSWPTKEARPSMKTVHFHHLPRVSLTRTSLICPVLIDGIFFKLSCYYTKTF